MDIPANLEARRRISFFATSLFMGMPSAPKVRNMLSFRLNASSCSILFLGDSFLILQIFVRFKCVILSYLDKTFDKSMNFYRYKLVNSCTNDLLILKFAVNHVLIPSTMYLN